MEEAKLPRIRYDAPQLDAIEQRAADYHKVPLALMRAVRLAGERSHSDQESPKKALGIYQFTPETWAKFARPHESRQDPVASAFAAARYLRYGLERYKGDPLAVMAEYNGGPKAAAKYLETGEGRNKEVSDYLKKTHAFLKQNDPALLANTRTDQFVKAGTEIGALKGQPQQKAGLVVNPTITAANAPDIFATMAAETPAVGEPASREPSPTHLSLGGFTPGEPPETPAAAAMVSPHDPFAIPGADALTAGFDFTHAPDNELQSRIASIVDRMFS